MKLKEELNIFFNYNLYLFLIPKKSKIPPIIKKTIALILTVGVEFPRPNIKELIPKLLSPHKNKTNPEGNNKPMSRTKNINPKIIKTVPKPTPAIGPIPVQKVPTPRVIAANPKIINIKPNVPLNPIDILNNY